MRFVYVYLLNTLADWELGYITSELNSKRFFKKDAAPISVKTVSISKEAITTMGGMKIVPGSTIDEIVESKENVLILPGANTWENLENKAIIEKAQKFISIGATVCAICGATVALANAGLLDKRPHTSNGVGFIQAFSTVYQGDQFYVDVPSVSDGNLITASCTGSLLWAKQIIEKLDVFKRESLEAWYAYFNTGKAEKFFALMQTLKD
ncbi:MAG: glutamine amidotransferase [Fibrobacteraceae bacterium]|nr:glutamine amidotransferase [Fibrobacteraceae bacterium]